MGAGATGIKVFNDSEGVPGKVYVSGWIIKTNDDYYMVLWELNNETDRSCAENHKIKYGYGI